MPFQADQSINREAHKISWAGHCYDGKTSVTSHAPNTVDNVWVVLFYVGFAGPGGKDFTPRYSWCVRGGMQESVY